ncbi:MAG: DUF4349 domain-containing protein [Spirochaetota bacterium]
MFRTLPVALALLVLAAAASVVTCRNGVFAGSAEKEYSAYDEEVAPAPEVSEQAAKRSAPVGSTADEAAASETPPDAAGSAAVRPPAQDRKRVYSGYAELLVDDIEETKAKVQALSQSEGGYVEESYRDSIVVRVPAERFAALVEIILTYGEVLDSWEETVDVTEYFTDLETRLRIARETRDRFYVLLEKTEDPEERVEILREIRRLTEEIEGIELRFDHLKELIKYSRITVALRSRLDYYGTLERDIPFPWIENLHPLHPSIFELKGTKGLDNLTGNFAVFDKARYFSAENPSGVRVRMGTVTNDPAGDETFWRDALEYHLSPFYAEAREAETGTDEFKAVLFTGKEREPYYYLVGVYVEGKKIHVAELFFPDKDAFDENFEPLLSLLASREGS